MRTVRNAAAAASGGAVPQTNGSTASAGLTPDRLQQIFEPTEAQREQNVANGIDVTQGGLTTKLAGPVAAAVKKAMSDAVKAGKAAGDVAPFAGIRNIGVDVATQNGQTLAIAAETMVTSKDHQGVMRYSQYFSPSGEALTKATGRFFQTKDD